MQGRKFTIRRIGELNFTTDVVGAVREKFIIDLLAAGWHQLVP